MQPGTEHCRFLVDTTFEPFSGIRRWHLQLTWVKLLASWPCCRLRRAAARRYSCSTLSPATLSACMA